MIELLKNEFLDVINAMRRGDAPEWITTPHVRFEDIADYTFDVDDPKNNVQTIKCSFGTGTASYVNGKSNNTYQLRFVCYDDYLHQFVFDDGIGHADKSILKQHTRMADFIVYDTSENNVWIIIHELSKGDVNNKRNRGRVQLATTIEMLNRSKNIKKFIENFTNKWCVLSARDERVLHTPCGMADAFMNAYTILPEPMKFQFGAMKRLGFWGYETSKVILI